MRWPARGGAEVHRRRADGPRGLRRSAPQGVLPGGDRVQGIRFLPDRQPEGVVGRRARNLLLVIFVGRQERFLFRLLVFLGRQRQGILLLLGWQRQVRGRRQVL